MPSARARLTNIDVKIARDGIRAQVVRALRQAIIAGELLPGQRLIEVDLCNVLEISRPTLREALRHLESERLVNFIQNRGCFVTTLEWSDAEQIYETRLLLEPEMAFRAATHNGAALKTDLQRCLDEFRDALSRGARLEQVTASDRFYEVIFDAAGNVIIKDILESLNARISLLRGRSMSYPGRTAHSLQELEEIANAISRGDADSARDAARVHVANACASARLAMQREDSPTE